MAVAWLMRHHGLDLETALREVRMAIPDTQINPTLLAALEKLSTASP